MTRTEKLLRELIAIPSVNPAFLPEGDPYTGEQRMADYVARIAKSAGFAVEFREVQPGRPNVLVRMNPRGKARQRLVLAPHLDTVGGSELPGAFFTPKARDGRLYGRGACDTKGTLAAMLTAMLELAQKKERPSQTEILLVGLIDEECGQLGSRALVAGKLKADLAIVGEPTRLKVVTAHKGVLWLKLKTYGTAAHGSHPELGVNAVHLMARLVDGLETEYAARLRERRHPLLGQPTINVGSMHGGTQPNIVPAECTTMLDRRIIPGEDDQSAFAEIQQFVEGKAFSPKAGKLQGGPDPVKLRQSERPVLELQPLHSGPCLALETDFNLPLVQLFCKCVGQSEPAGVDYFSDAGVLSHGGIPSILFGPGDIAQAHKPDEWICLKQLDQGKNLLLQYLASLP